ncbi:MAG: hypothetical protein KDC47_10620 [Flavobacteriaceae bacterium]|nr:hypothetical protein [Flavobacteriaceae bacterium]
MFALLLAATGMRWSIWMATLSRVDAPSGRDDIQRLGAALAAIAQRKPTLALPSPAARHLLTQRKPSENPFAPHIGARRPPYNF